MIKIYLTRPPADKRKGVEIFDAADAQHSFLNRPAVAPYQITRRQARLAQAWRVSPLSDAAKYAGNNCLAVLAPGPLREWRARARPHPVAAGPLRRPCGKAFPTNPCWAVHHGRGRSRPARSG